jgi:hypothetical protein
MIRSVAAMMTLALSAAAPAWAQETVFLREEALEGAPDGEPAEEPAEEKLEELGEEELEGAEAPGGEEAVEATEGEALEGAAKTEEGAEEADEALEPEDAETPAAPTTPAPALFREQLGTLVADLRRDRESGRRYARPAERGTEAAIHAVSLAIRDQLLANECWTEDDIVIEGRRETIAIAVRFDVDGRFVEEPRLVSPPDMPEDDPRLEAFIGRTFRALRTCNASGLSLPPKYFEDPIWVYLILQSRPE